MSIHELAEGLSGEPSLTVFLRGAFLVAFVACGACCESALASEIVWKGESGGKWGEAENWTGGVVPGAGDAAVFNLANDMRVVLAESVSVSKIAVTGSRLFAFSRMGASVAMDGSSPEISVAAGATLRISGALLAGDDKIAKTGAGKLIVVGKAASAINLEYAEGELELEDECGKTVTVSSADGLWKYEGVTSAGASVANTPYGGTDGIYVGNNYGGMVTVTARKEPIRINGRVRITGDVRMEGTGSWGFAAVIHNDPRGCLAHAVCQQDSCMGYAGNNVAVKQAITKSFAFGLINHYSSDGKVLWGWNGQWQTDNAVGVLTDPFIYTSPCGADSTTEKHPREFKLQLDFDQGAQTATITLVQDQSEIVTGGGTAVTWTKTLTGINLVSLCDGDTATLAFTSDAGGRNTKALISNLKVEYFAPTGTVKDTVTVAQADNLWTNRCFSASGTEWNGSTYGTDDGSVCAGANAGSAGSVTARREKVNVRGKVRLSGKVTDSGSGSHGWALVLHNDPRGFMAHAAVSQSLTMLFSGTSKIENGYAFRICNYYNTRGQVGDGKNGTWNSLRTTSPLILTNPWDDSAKVLSEAKYDFTATFDERLKTMVLTLSQEQSGETVTATETFTDVDLPTLVGDGCAWLSLTSDAGGRSTNVTIDDFKIEYLSYGDETSDYSFFKSLETSGANPVITATSGDSSFVAGLGEVTVDRGTLQLGSGRSAVTVVNGRWDQKCVPGTGDEYGGLVYGTGSGSIRAGARVGNVGSVTACKDKVYVGGKFRISGKVTDSGSGSHGFAVVLHNDSRGYLAHAAQAGDASMLFSGTSAIGNSHAFRICNYYGTRGQVGDGANGTWNSLRTTSPLIQTNPYDESTKLLTVARYDFEAVYDERAGTMTLALTQEQSGETVASTNVFNGVDLPSTVGDTYAWLSITSDAGGRSTDITIDDFRIDYLSYSDDRSVFSCTGPFAVSEDAGLSLCDSVFRVTSADQLFDFGAVGVYGTSMLNVGSGITARVKVLCLDGTKLGAADYTADNCDWVGGEGTVMVWRNGTLILLR